MILPTKFLPAERSLIVIGGEIISLLRNGPRSVSELWERIRSDKARKYPVGYDWFTLALTLLYMIDAVDWRSGLIALKNGSSS
ncbi:ABC-three component system middle component 6 [Rhizobium cauense]|uniref:ABC-three component system middle component 6 n=1 Tax=Rhizobium cauense TaxID=1166683 RepID=UPI0030B8F52B